MNAPAPRCYCPACQTRAALQLLESGRVGMATSILRDMVRLLDEAEREAAAQKLRKFAEFPDAAAEAAVVAAEPEEPPQRRTRPERPPRGAQGAFKRLASEMRGHVARLGPQRVAELLGLRPSDLDGLMEGTVSLPSSALVKLRKA